MKEKKKLYDYRIAYGGVLSFSDYNLLLRKYGWLLYE